MDQGPIPTDGATETLTKRPRAGGASRLACDNMVARRSTILRVSAYWTNVQRVLRISVLIFGLQRFGGHETTLSCFLIGQVDGNILVPKQRFVVYRGAELRRRRAARATSCSSTRRRQPRLRCRDRCEVCSTRHPHVREAVSQRGALAKQSSE